MLQKEFARSVLQYKKLNRASWIVRNVETITALEMGDSRGLLGHWS
jgi:hypothetical protein